jgi:hypothetical protein
MDAVENCLQIRHDDLQKEKSRPEGAAFPFVRKISAD